ncbi:surface carbohydrate biosynthesis protein [Qipengyuania nanhaisediminis]|uniref:surface carbohydrate biosynthesis protein n=1 Tax=Qipengyuania nanhaisediminis TaxID=604088 RepID=UPI0038B351DA
MFLGDVPRRRIGLVVDHPERDLDGLCLVAQRLAERGHESVLLPFYTQHFDLPNIRLDAIVLNYVRPANLALVRAAAARGIALVVLDTEGGLLPDSGPTSPAGIARFLRASGIDRQLALYLFWGEALRERILADTALPAHRALVTGCPRFDLARREYNAPSGTPAVILVNTNFPVVNPALADGSAIDDRALASVGFAPDEIRAIAQSVQLVMDRVIDAVQILARARPARRFVVRPHPFEALEPYHRAFDGFENVTVRRTGSAVEALASASCMLHVNCTTAIEACQSGVPPISLDFLNEAALVRMARLPSRISHGADSIEQALDLIDRAESLSAGVMHEAITPHFGPLDGKAAIRIAEALADRPLPSSAGEDPQPWRQRIAAALGAAIGSRAIESARRAIRPARSIKGFTLSQVRDRIDRFAGLHGHDAARVEPLRTALGLPIMALRISPSSEKNAMLHDLDQLEGQSHA